MIHSKSELEERRKALLSVVHQALKALTPRELLRGHVRVPDVEKFDRIAVISIGKAAKAMSTAFVSLLPRKPDFNLLADTGHPLPTKEGMKKSAKIIKVARSLTERDIVFVLLSGGGSAMFTAPVKDILFEDKISTTNALIKCGATIQEINIVRKHLSQVKGGNLARLLYPATVYGLVISDVMDNDLSTISSGPLSPDQSTFKDALNVLKKHKVVVPASVKKYLEKGLKNSELETVKKDAPYFKKVSIKIIADHMASIKIAEKIAREQGFKVKLIKTPITGEAREVVKDFIESAAAKSVVIASGETTVTCTGKGSGGRNQEFVIGGLKYLKENQMLASVGTDGVDGMCPSPVAGAVGDFSTAKKAQSKKISVEKFLKNNDSYHFCKKVGGHIKTGPTGTNLGDLMFLYSW